MKRATNKDIIDFSEGDVKKQYPTPEIEFFNLRKNAYKGGKEDQFELGLAYEDSEMMEKLHKINIKSNLKKAKYWYMKSCENNCGEACYNLAGFFFTEKSSLKENDMGVSLYKKSYALGRPEAAYALGIHYLQHNQVNKSIKWFENSIKIGPYWGESHYELAKIFYDRAEYIRALDLFLKALETNNVTQFTKEEILFYIAKYFFYGFIVKKDIGVVNLLLSIANIDYDHDDIIDFLKANINKLKKVAKTNIDVLDILRDLRDKLKNDIDKTRC